MSLPETNGTSDSASMESFSGSWIKLDSRNEGSAETSPKLSDDEEMTEALADAQNEMNKSVINQSTANEEAVASKSNQDDAELEANDKRKENRKSTMSLRGSKVITCGFDLVEHPIFCVSALLLSHTFAVVLGIFIGRKMVSQSR